MNSDKEKKKVMFLMGKLEGGGAERVLVDTINNLSPEKYDVTLILVENTGIYLKNLAPHVKFKYFTSKENINQIKLFYRLKHYLPFKLIYRFYVKESYDIEIAFLEGLATYIVGNSTNLSKKYAWVHTDMKENRWADVDFKSERQQQKIYHKFDKVVCVSNYCKEKFTERFGNDYPITTLYNVVCDNIIKKKSYCIPRTFVNKNKFTFISSGRFIFQKGFDRLLKIHKKLLDENYIHDLWLLGDGDMRQKLELYIQTNNLQDSVKLFGFLENPYPFMKEADAFVCSSRSEGYSTVVTEALILGLPVISVKCSGASELLCDGKYGLLVENEDLYLYKAMKVIMEDKTLYSKMKKLAVERGNHFSMEKRIAEIEKLLDD